MGPISERHKHASPPRKWDWLMWSDFLLRLSIIQSKEDRVLANTQTMQYFWMTQLDPDQVSFPLNRSGFNKTDGSVTSLARTWEYSMSSSYSVSMWSLVNAMGTRRIFFHPRSQSPLMVSSVWGPSQGIGPTWEKGGWVSSGPTSPAVGPSTAPAIHTFLESKGQLYTCSNGFWYFHMEAGILLEIGRLWIPVLSPQLEIIQWVNGTQLVTRFSLRQTGGQSSFCPW